MGDTGRDPRRRCRCGASSPLRVWVRLVDVEKVLEDVSKALGAWTYLLVAGFAFAETGAFVGLLVPGETVMILGGAVAGQGAIDVYILIAVAWACAFAGDSTSFFVGRRLGREFLMRHGPRFGIGKERLGQVDDYFDRHGGKTIFIGRFVGFVRAFAPFIAGSSGMRYRAFVPYSVLGTGFWASSAIVIGYLFSRSIDTAAPYAGSGAFLLATLIVIVGRGCGTACGSCATPRTGAARSDWTQAPMRLTRWLVLLGRRLRPAGALPLESGDAGRHLRPRVHLADGDPCRRRLRARRLHGRARRRSEPDAGGRTAGDIAEQPGRGG